MGIGNSQMMRGGGIRVLSVGVYLAVSVWLAAKEGREQQVARLWEADLDNFSYALRPDPHYIGGKAHIGGKFVDIGVVTTAFDEVICYFVKKTDAGHLQRREELEASDPFQLQLVSFDAKTGSFKYTKQLPTRSGFSSVITNNEGNYIVRSGDFLRLYSKGFVLLKERKLERSQQHIMDEWRQKFSTSGKTLLLNHYSPSGTYDEILDSSSLEMLLKLKVPKFRDFSVSEKTILKADRDHNELFIYNLGGHWQRLAPQQPLLCISNPVLINDGTIMNACGHQVVLLSTGGDVLMRDAAERDEHFEELVSVTPDGRFFAVSAMRTKGGFMDYTSIKRSRTRILVYDTGSRKQIASIPVEPVPKKDYDFALTPDGSKLAVMTDDKLRVYASRPKDSLP